MLTHYEESLACAQGALPDRMLATLIENGAITGANQANIGPASLDLTFSEEAYLVPGLRMLAIGETVREMLRSRKAIRHDLNQPMWRGASYLVRLNEYLAFPSHVYGFSNPRSKTGRHDILARMMADRVESFDSAAPYGYSGELWVAVSPNSFPVIIPAGSSVNQLRCFTRDTRLNRDEIFREYRRIPLLYGPERKPIPLENLRSGIGEGDSLILTLDLFASKEGNMVSGWECRGTDHVLDYRKGKGGYRERIEDFFVPIRVHDDETELKPESFYILTSREPVLVPPWLACEMIEMDSRYGEFRAHYAGFIDPGWGYGKFGSERGRQLTLEVRTLGRSVTLRHGQPIARIRFERMATVPAVLYDEKISDFTKQHGPQLSSFFM